MWVAGEPWGVRNTRIHRAEAMQCLFLETALLCENSHWFLIEYFYHQARPPVGYVCPKGSTRPLKTGA